MPTLKKNPDNLIPFSLCAGILLVLLQSYLLMCGCLGPAGRTEAKDPGRSLYAAQCGACHRLIEPHEQPPDVWQQYVTKYGRRLSADEKQVILNYLVVDGSE